MACQARTVWYPTTELVEATEGQLTRAAIQQRLRAAVNIGLFSQQPVRFEEGLAGKTMLHHFINPALLISQLGIGSLNSEQTKAQEKAKTFKGIGTESRQPATV